MPRSWNSATAGGAGSACVPTVTRTCATRRLHARSYTTCWPTRRGVTDRSTAEPRVTAELRGRLLAWEQENGLPEAFAGSWSDPRAAPEVPPETALQTFVLNEGRWPENLPPERQCSVESYAEAFTRATAKESSVFPEQFDLSLYKRIGGRPLTGTPWEDAWRKA